MMEDKKSIWSSMILGIELRLLLGLISFVFLLGMNVAQLWMQGTQIKANSDRISSLEKNQTLQDKNIEILRVQQENMSEDVKEMKQDLKEIKEFLIRQQ